MLPAVGLAQPAPPAAPPAVTQATPTRGGIDLLVRQAEHWLGQDRADLAAVCAATYLAHKWPGVFDADARPALEHYRAGWEARAPFTQAPFPAE